MSTPSNGERITRRDAIRRTVVFAAGTVIAGQSRSLRATPAVTNFDAGGMHLLALGDYGTKGSDSQRSVATAMARFAKSLDKPLEAVLALGDNFYNKLTPDRFVNHFEKMYSTDGLNCPFYACAGNHDYGTAKYDYQDGKLQMQLDYAKQNPNSRWKMPSKWYAVELPNAEAPLVKAIILDGNYWEGGLTPKEKIAQRRFLQAELEKPTTAPWLWIVNHFPIFSECDNRGDNQPLIREWGHLIQKYSVALCFAGHDHTMQHLRCEGYGTNFLVAGAGGANLYDVKPSQRGFVNNKHFGFTHIHVMPDELQVQFINADGDRLHHFRRDREGSVTVVS